MMMTTNQKLTLLRESMRAYNVHVLLVPSDDYHQSEYVGDFFKARAFLSGFTGSAGTLVVTLDDARLFTDGRYFIQAERQLAGSDITLMKSGTPGVPAPSDFIASVMKPGMTLAFDGRCVAHAAAESLRGKLPDGVSVRSDLDFPGMIWQDRPALPAAPIRELDEKYHGRSHADKLADVRKILAEKGCTALVLASLCDIAWLYNLRGGDVAHTPVFLSYAIVSADRDMLFLNRDALESAPAGVELRGYDEIWDALDALSDEKVLVDKSAVSDAVIAHLPKSVTAAPNPTLLLKAKKNETELKNTRLAHLADGLAVTKLMLELKYGEREFDEVSVGEYLYALRRECAARIGVTLLDESFAPICAFGANGAIVHYKASPDSAAKIDKAAPIPMLLVDSGGQYLEGTTDITRTFVLGEIPAEVRVHYTRVAMGMLRLAGMIFPEGTSGKALDGACRAPLWEIGLDFRHGTGHGVGHLLSVHEGPNRFHWKSADTPFEPGMITSDEPGYYEENSHGIRIENEICCVPVKETEYGSFLGFELLTFCPIDLDGIDLSVMDSGDIFRLNDYHRRVFDALSPYLCAGDREKLAYLTRSL